jgi:starvation-inducible DNA-binding protein
MEFEILDRLLATIAVTTQNVRGRHWTLYGEHYKSWHPFFDEVYKKLNEAADNVAELIVQLGGVPVHSMSGFIETSVVADMVTLGDWRRYVRETRDELAEIIEIINKNDKEGVWDGAASNDLTQIASTLRHYYMFAAQTLLEE